mgnify:CR=1 FL=1
MFPLIATRPPEMRFESIATGGHWLGDPATTLAPNEFNALTNSNRLLHQKIETVVFEVESLAAQEQEGLQKREVLSVRQRVLGAEHPSTLSSFQVLRVLEDKHRSN